MRHRFLHAAFAALLFGSSATFGADEVKVYEKDGITIRETTQVIPQPMTETRLEPRERTVYRDRYTTDMKPMDRSYVVPITEYQWQPRWEYGWNVFAPPSLVYRQVPVTRWETRKETVRVPVTRRELIPEKQVENVPVTKQKFAERVIITRVEVSPGTTAVAAGSSDPFAPADLSVARREPIGAGSKLESDPPRQGSAWKPPSSMMRK